jgi:hypothetical protein
MDHERVAEAIARQFASVWSMHRTDAFVKYLLQTFGCEPLKPVAFHGLLLFEMTDGFTHRWPIF